MCKEVRAESGCGWCSWRFSMPFCPDPDAGELTFQSLYMWLHLVVRPLVFWAFGALVRQSQFLNRGRSLCYRHSGFLCPFGNVYDFGLSLWFG